MIDDDTSYCTNNRLRAAMGSGEGRPVRGHPAPGVIWLHAPQTVPCRWGAAQATLRAWRPPRPCGRTRGPRGMLSLGPPGATRQGHPDQLEVAVGTLMSHLHCYILALAAERVSRDTDIWLEPPTLANLFDAEREVRGQRRAAEGP